jgi:predicted dinucleotide-binding enzyme
MRIATIGRGTIGGTLARLWTSAGHEVDALGREGGDVSSADVVLLAVPHAAVRAALSGVTGLQGKIVIDATNRLEGGDPPDGHPSIAEFVKAATGGPTAKAFNLNFGVLFDQARAAPSAPHNLWVGDEGARAAVEQLSRDIGMDAIHGGPLERAATQEAFASMFISAVKDAGAGLLFYRFFAPEAH